MLDYYKKELFLAKVDKNDKIIDSVERWHAHKKGILHRGFTLILEYKNQYLLQHRKHPAFDGFYDLTFSSHQIMVKNKLQPDLEAINVTLEREWDLKEKDLFSAPVKKGQIYYQAKDPNSEFTEHEIDYVYIAKLKKLPQLNSDFAYNFELVKKKDILNTYYLILNTDLCPWVEKIIENYLA